MGLSERSSACTRASMLPLLLLLRSVSGLTPADCHDADDARDSRLGDADTALFMLQLRRDVLVGLSTRAGRDIGATPRLQLAAEGSLHAHAWMLVRAQASIPKARCCERGKIRRDAHLALAMMDADVLAGRRSASVQRDATKVARRERVPWQVLQAISTHFVWALAQAPASSLLSCLEPLSYPCPTPRDVTALTTPGPVWLPTALHLAAAVCQAGTVSHSRASFEGLWAACNNQPEEEQVPMWFRERVCGEWHCTLNCDGCGSAELCCNCVAGLLSKTAQGAAAKAYVARAAVACTVCCIR